MQSGFRAMSLAFASAFWRMPRKLDAEVSGVGWNPSQDGECAGYCSASHMSKNEPIPCWSFDAVGWVK
jgi:hypothetical protein